VRARVSPWPIVGPSEIGRWQSLRRWARRAAALFDLPAGPEAPTAMMSRRDRCAAGSMCATAGAAVRKLQRSDGRIYTRAELEPALCASGVANIACFADFKGSAFDDERSLPDECLEPLELGEAAYDATLEPLGRLMIATSYDTGRTKTEVTRRVPVHPTLAKVLASWKLSHWERIYGRAPTADDLIIPTRTMKPIDKTDAARAMKADLVALGLRVEAGKNRSRGGHALRSWFITTCQEHGAHRDLLRVVTHTAKGDIMSGYTPATWGALCTEVEKLQVGLIEGRVLELATGFATAELKSRNRWQNMVTPPGLEPGISA
jgi:hypothetical protein